MFVLMSSMNIDMQTVYCLDIDVFEDLVVRATHKEEQDHRMRIMLAGSEAPAQTIFLPEELLAPTVGIAATGGELDVSPERMARAKAAAQRMAKLGRQHNK